MFLKYCIILIGPEICVRSNVKQQHQKYMKTNTSENPTSASTFSLINDG